MSDITYAEAKYLKTSGEDIDAKVSIRIIEKRPVVCVHDYEFRNYHSALLYLQSISRSIAYGERP